MLPIRRTYSSNLMESLLDDIFDYKSMNLEVKTPIHDIMETDNEFQVEMLLAGIKKEDISLDIEKDMLIIKAERKESNDMKYNRKETYFGKYERSFKLPDYVDKDKINASLVDGILKIIIPKAENNTKLSRTIEIM